MTQFKLKFSAYLNNINRFIKRLAKKKKKKSIDCITEVEFIMLSIYMEIIFYFYFLEY